MGIMRYFHQPSRKFRVFYLESHRTRPPFINESCKTAIHTHPSWKVFVDRTEVLVQYAFIGCLNNDVQDRYKNVECSAEKLNFLEPSSPVRERLNKEKQVDRW